MIQHLSRKYKKVSASLLLTVFYLNFLFSAAYSMELPLGKSFIAMNNVSGPTVHSYRENATINNDSSNGSAKKEALGNYEHKVEKQGKALTNNMDNIGGPSQPEMSSFKSVGADNMVNLFTGDFNYNIPLMDVGGYPINLFYDASVGMEQEASWVGLGWNINPGNINRNMRGVPDDFDGTEMLMQKQTMKPNKTWGVNLGADLELVGLKNNQNLSLGVNGSLGVSINNYLGPALEIGGGVSASATLAEVSKKAGSEKSLASSVGVGASLSSRNGLTISPYASLSGQAALNDKGGSVGLGLSASTSFNSRSGIKALQLGEQMSFNRGTSKESAGIQDYANKHNGVSVSLMSTSISFAKPSYVPTMRMKITNSSTAGRFQLGGAIFGIYGSAQLQGYSQKSEVSNEDVLSSKPMFGYMNYQKAADNPDAIMDFTRFNDKEVMPTTPIISVPQYSYDVFSIQGEGTGGSIRAYRSDLGYVRDNIIQSRDKSAAAGLDIGIPGHVGGNFSIVKTPSTSGDWNENNRLRTSIGFKANSKDVENVYFGNPGECTVINSGYYNAIGGTDLVRYQMDGASENPVIEPILDQFSSRRLKIGTADPRAFNALPQRKKRSQVVSFLTAAEATKVGLDKMIRNYGQGTLSAASMPRIDDYRKAHHISEIDVTESDGKRYVYGLPVYNLMQKDFTFSVENPSHPDIPETVTIQQNDANELSRFLAGSNSNTKDGYLLTTETPGYAHSFLLTGLLSNDYVDVKGDGITEDDLGTAVKFNYSKMSNVVWRTPLSNNLEANFNPGKRTEAKDDKGIVSYGERESWYLHSIESKSMVAVFTLEAREDGKGAFQKGAPGSNTENLGGVNSNDNSKKRLKKIDLYNKADIMLQNRTEPGPIPIKTVWFDYDYRLCQGTQDRSVPGGKLTLIGIHFTYNGKRENSSVKNKYVFAYSYDKSVSPTNNQDNPGHELNNSDRWGTYKNKMDNPGNLQNSVYPYVIQDKTKAGINAGAWALKKILLPSGGQIEVKYESDDYAFVQNKRAAVMTQILGFSDNSNGTFGPKMYSVNPGANSTSPFIKENNYVFIKVPVACQSDDDVQSRYLKDVEQLAFKLAVKMPKGTEYINSYATFENKKGSNNFGLWSGDLDKKTIWIKLTPMDDFNPLSLSAIEFLRQQLPGQAYKGYDVSENSGLKQQFNMLMGLLDGLVSASIDPINFLRIKGLAQQVEVDKSFVRLNCADGHKLGGGHRVKSITLADNFNFMKPGLYRSTYGKEYDYTTTEILDGVERSISSGVASYEPSFGGEENPCQKIWQYSSGAPLGPANYDAVEMPVMDAFFPAPLVGYSKVTVRSTNPKPTSTSKPRSVIGKQVSEFYTAKDFPIYTNYTDLNPESDKSAHASAGEIFYSYFFDSRAITQGFVVALNDMHGKLKSQSSYKEYDDKTPIYSTQNFYKNTGVAGLTETFKFVSGSDGGGLSMGNMGIDIELMTDLRQFTQKTKSFEIQAQVDLFPFGIPFWFPFIWPISGKGENTYRAATTTKVINYHSVLDRVVVIDNGSEVSTENMVYDAETGEPLVTKTNNEFDKKIFNISYPAYWAFSGMGPSYKNIGAIYTANFKDGIINIPTTIFESGDELCLIDPGTPSTDPCAAQYNNNTAAKLWVFDTDKDTKSLTNTTPHFVFMDESGLLYSRENVVFKIVRSGKRNMLNAKLMSLTSMTDPTETSKLTIDDNTVINVSAVDYKEKWQTDDDVFKRYVLVHDNATCTNSESNDCNGYLEKQINPYVKGLLGNFRPNKSLVFYEDRKERVLNKSVPEPSTNLMKNGFLINFKKYWDFDINNNLVADGNASTAKKWVTASETTRLNSKGLELETRQPKDTKNASDDPFVYTTAQYGYNKTLPVAIANNAHYNEMFAEGFEDYNYNEELHPDGTSCAKNFRYIDFSNASGTSNPQVVTSSETFMPHTGQNALRFGPGGISKYFAIGNENYQYPLQIGQETQKVLNSLGGNKVSVEQVRYPNADLAQPTFGDGGFGVTVQKADNISYQNNGYDHTFEIKVSYYIKVIQSGLYTFNLSGTMLMLGEDDIFSYNYGIGMFVKIKDISTDHLISLSTPTPPLPRTQGAGTVFSSENVPLCPGIYLIEASFGEAYHANGEASKNTGSMVFSFSCPGLLGSPCYDKLTETEQCPFRKPIPSLANMINPTFGAMLNPSTDKKMLFSAWVKEDCPTPPCPSTGYTHSAAEISFNNGTVAGVTLNPSGPVIEGWQKIEGAFTVPQNSTSMGLKFLNTNATSNTYLDDIRIQPFNANMKSYVYDPVNLRLLAQLDENNFASFYEYDEEGTLIRTKIETKEGVKTLTETRTAKQKSIDQIQ